MSNWTILDLAKGAVGLRFGDPALRPTYLALQYPGDPPAVAAEMGRHQSGCLLFYRGLAARAGLDGRASWRGAVRDLLREPYGAPVYLGKVEGLLQEWAKAHRLIRPELWRGDSPPELQPGDLVAVGNLGSPPALEPHRGQWQRDWGGVTHGLVVERVEGVTVHSIDGGQTDARNGGRPTAITRRERKLERRPSGWWLGGRRLSWLIRADGVATFAPEPPTALDLGTTLGLQTALAQLGYDPGRADGVMGPRTRAAVVAFQRAKGLTADGIVGPRTREALARALAGG